MSVVFLVLFGLTLFASYIIIRREWMRLTVIGGLCAVLTVTSIMLYGLTKEDRLSLGHSVIAGLAVGLGFTGAMLAMAVFFLRNQPDELKAYLPEVPKDKR